MNERIRQLAEQAGFLNKDEESIEYFAELIVKECVQACINEGKTYEVKSAGEYASNLYATAIKKHFGVET
jgi:hypothetical protein